MTRVFTDNEIAALIEKLEAATGPDRALDRRIFLLTRVGWDERSYYHFCGMLPKDSSNTSENNKFEFARRHAPHFTASIDTALTLVPQEQSSNYEVCLEQHKRRTRTYWDVTIGHMYHDAFHGQHANPAIALVIAALKARAAMASAHEVSNV